VAPAGFVVQALHLLGLAGKGLSPATIINDAPISFDAGQTGGQAWEPKNYDGKYEGPMTMRKGLTKSKNMISIRILHRIGAKYGQEYATRFGFDADKNPPYLTLALGAGNVTPLQMAGAYAVFANGGYKVSPYLIAKVTDADGKSCRKPIRTWRATRRTA
jgi:penicillin-binding protein 1A